MKFLFFLLCPILYAQTLTNNTPVSIKVPYKSIGGLETISHTTPTEITGNTADPQTTNGISAVWIFNMDTSATLYCGSNPALTTSGSNMGLPIAPFTGAEPYWFFWAISTTQGWYCLSSGAGNTSAWISIVK